MEWDCGQGVVIVFSAAEDMTNANDLDGGFLTSAVLASDIGKPPSVMRPLTIGAAFQQIRVNVWEQNQRQSNAANFRQVPVLSCSHCPSLTSPLYF